LLPPYSDKKGTKTQEDEGFSQLTQLINVPGLNTNQDFKPSAVYMFHMTCPEGL
jgi:hypothetical protein